MEYIKLFFELGLTITNHDESKSRSTAHRKYRSFFGVSPLICSICWTLLKNKLPNYSRPIHLLWALLFLKKYETEEVSVALTKADAKKFRKWSWIFVDLLSNLNMVRNKFIRSSGNCFCFLFKLVDYLGKS